MLLIYGEVFCIMKPKEIREIILRELPTVLEQDKEVQNLILRLSKEHFADKRKTEDRFDKILKELAEDREIQNKKWEGQAKRWEEQDKRWGEQEKKWQENQKIIHEILESVKALSRKHDNTIGALGARWGLRSEQSFRNALKGILGEVPELEVINVVEYDEEGEVFGRPDQIELDLIIKNGLFMICEIKSSMSKADVHIFYKKAEFYQKKHNRKAQRLMVVSPMIDKKALELARDLGIQTYSYVEDIEPNAFSV
jgi:hypothetical protein